MAFIERVCIRSGGVCDARDECALIHASCTGGAADPVMQDILWDVGARDWMYGGRAEKVESQEVARAYG